MPIYVYKAADDGCEQCGAGWEVLQNMDEDPLTECPRCGAPVRRVPTTFNAGQGDVLSDSNLREHGFQKLRNTEDGLRREV